MEATLFNSSIYLMQQFYIRLLFYLYCMKTQQTCMVDLFKTHVACVKH